MGPALGRPMGCAMSSILPLIGLLAVAGLPGAGGSFLYQPSDRIDHVLRLPAEAYVPQPGDIMLRLDGSAFWRVTHYMALAFDPNGSGIVVARADGRLAILEAGPNDTMGIRNMEMLPHL